MLGRKICILRTKSVKPVKPMKTLKNKRKDLKNKLLSRYSSIFTLSV
ncbi:unnamed protein product [Brassica rapa]|uniref:Uncharacterized protein n=1 Tax=Brassica campestris TaxID=3711 RepID=A0A8D9GN43_BRACM|nr:unnamed protein product [Brassica rapa]